MWSGSVVKWSGGIAARGSASVVFCMVVLMVARFCCCAVVRAGE